MQRLYLVILILVAVLFTAYNNRSPEPQAPTDPDRFTEAYAPGRTGEVREITLLLPGETEPSTVTVEVFDGVAVFQGDIDLGEIDALELTPQSIQISGSNALWPGNTIPYELDADLSTEQRGWITDAITEWESNTALRLVKRRGQENYVYFKAVDEGCSSPVGKSPIGSIFGKRTIRLSDDCGLGATIHEIGHSAGLWHEQSRSDRNKYVEVRLDNVESGKKHNFDQHTGDGTDFGSYDYRSIMHYRCWSFSKNGNKTLIPLSSNVGCASDEGKAITVGQRSGLSSGDIASINSKYPAGPYADLFEGDGATQDVVCTVMLGPKNQTVSFQGHTECENDEVRSLVLYELPVGRVVRLFDHPDGKEEDDWIEIIAKRDLASKTIANLETSFEDDDVKVIYHRNNGLNGKVSRLTANSTPTGALVALYEGNSATQNLVCSLKISSDRKVDFTNHSQCDNDEARSLVLYDVPAGRVVRLFDHPDGKKDDDWVEMKVLSSITRKVISSFEKSFKDEFVEVTYHSHNGLDGKVSRLTVGGNATPTISILEPDDGATLGYGGSNVYSFKAQTNDVEDGLNCCDVVWEAEQLGQFGQGHEFDYAFAAPGVYKVTATVTDSGGDRATDTITLTVENLPPKANILMPTQGEERFRGVPVTLKGEAVDGNSLGGVPCENLQWSSNLEGALGTGCSLQVSFQTLGSHILTLSATDPFGLSDTATVGITIVEPPELWVSITSPKEDDAYLVASEIELTALLSQEFELPATYTWRVSKDQSNYTTVATGSVVQGRLSISIPEETWTPTTLYEGDRVYISLEVAAENGTLATVTAIDILKLQ